MSLFENWRELAYQHETKQSFDKFWNKYAVTEKKIYEEVLENHGQPLEGVLKELAEKYETSNEYFMGFLDGINESLREALDLEEITEDSMIKLDIDFEKLYYNMLEAKADYLYTLPQWDKILDEEKRKEITKAQRSAKTIVKENKIGRNEPCPCGSGKKYKKCCGK
ncbi:SEC-C metal-binding domain-containing protein [Crassaminicella indica]|uniref:SEC-C domain-containing protein n=1 Tax=Crassaminicella indica TaxID=2855394 RepID=A0ABX8R9B9_9CLOT|nr:SEC-C metal-binding domain-containing protein [Crassaminicella indica]QXM05663.1 SEC-C domain-containing protein [Crassaminicella indica]